MDWSDEELRQVPAAARGGAGWSRVPTYVDLRDPARREFTATGEMQVPIDGLYVPKTEVERPDLEPAAGGVPHSQAVRHDRLNRINLPTATSR